MHTITIHSDTVRSVEALLREWIGLDAQTLGSAAIERAVRMRMQAIGTPDEHDFLVRLGSDVAQRDQLIEEVVVPESWFFRDPHVFDFICRSVAEIAVRPGRGPVRVLCVPCASGEEPYSRAMALLDAGLAASQFHIDAVDVSHAALSRAAAGRYSVNAFRAADLSFRERWFRADDTCAVLDERVRQSVHFAWGNLLDASFAAEQSPYDFIFCRNVLIYLTTDARRRVEATIDRLLTADGLLVLGAAEQAIMKGPWRPAASHSMFTLHRGSPTPSRTSAADVVDGLRDSATVRPIRARSALPAASRPATAWLAAAHGDEPKGVPKTLTTAAVEDLPTGPGDLETILSEASSLANAGRNTEALEVCLRHKQQAGSSAALCFMMGMLHQSVGDLDRAEVCLQRTLYLDASHEEALLALALVASQRGTGSLAEQYRQTAARVRARKGTP